MRWCCSPIDLCYCRLIDFHHCKLSSIYTHANVYCTGRACYITYSTYRSRSPPPPTLKHTHTSHPHRLYLHEGNCCRMLPKTRGNIFKQEVASQDSQLCPSTTTTTHGPTDSRLNCSTAGTFEDCSLISSI